MHVYVKVGGRKIKGICTTTVLIALSIHVTDDELL